MSDLGHGDKIANIPFSRDLMVYRSRWTPTAVAGELYMLRGIIVSAFSHVDQLAMRVCVCAAQMPEYQFRPKPPTRTEEKIEFLRDALEREGPLADDRPLFLRVLARFEGLNEYRTQIAHASSQSLGNDAVSFPETVKVKRERVVVSKHNSTTMSEVSRQARRYVRFSRACESLHYKLMEKGQLPRVEFQSGWRSNLSPSHEPIEIPWPRPAT